MNTTALIPVDYENGFAHPEIWELYVAGWETLAPYIKDVIRETKQAGWLVIPTRDIHPEGHISFVTSFIWKEALTDALKRWDVPSDKNFITYEEVKNWTEENNGLSDTATFTVNELQAYLQVAGTQAMWPEHCKAETESSLYHWGIEETGFDYEIKKWFKANEECYSWFGGVEMKTETPLGKLLKDLWVQTVKVLWLATDYCVKATAIDAKKLGFSVELLTEWIKWVAPETTIQALEEMREQGIKIIE